MQILIRAPQVLKEALQKKATCIGVSLNALILQVLWEWYEREKKNDQKRKENT